MNSLSLRAGGPAVFLLSSLVWAAGEAPAEDLRVKAMTFNIRLSKANDGPNDWCRRKEMVRDSVRRFGGDFLGVQEAWPDQIAYLRDSLPEYGHLGRSREANACEGEAVPLFYRLDRWLLDATEHGTFWLSDKPDTPGSRSWGNFVPRIVTWGRFTEKQTGRGIYVYNVHLDHLSPGSRLRSAQYLARRIADRKHPEPVLVMGDFNSGESGGSVRYLKGLDSPSPMKFIDTFRALHPVEESVGTFHGFSGSRSGSKIDYVLTVPEAKVLSAEILHDHCDGRYPSDHFPVSAEVVFPAAGK